MRERERSDTAAVTSLRVGWLVEPGFGPIDAEVAATVRAAAEALVGAGCIVEPVRLATACPSRDAYRRDAVVVTAARQGT